MKVVKSENGLAFPRFEPMVTWNPAVMRIDLTVARLPRVNLAGTQPQPAQELSGRQVRPSRPVFQVVHNVVASVVGNPTSF